MTDKRNELKGKEKIIAKLTSFLEKNKTILWIILAVAVAAIIIVAIIDSNRGKKAAESAERIEAVQKDYQEWLGLEDDTEIETKQQELIEELDGVITEYPSSYAAQRAFFIKAGINFQNEEWGEAASFYSKSADINRESYLAPVALMLAASSFENAENYQNALEIYKDVYENYDKIYPDIPRAMLSIGRLNEQLDNKDAAIEAYNNLIDSYPDNGWSTFARTRIIQLD